MIKLAEWIKQHHIIAFSVLIYSTPWSLKIPLLSLFKGDQSVVPILCKGRTQ